MSGILLVIQPVSFGALQVVSFDRYYQLGRYNCKGIHKYLNYELFGYMHDILMRTDKMSMAASLEVRVPYLMPELIEFYQTIPDNYIINARAESMRGTKMLLKDLCSDVFGDDFTYRSKMGLTNPLLDFFQDIKVRHYVDSHLIPGIKKRNIANIDFIKQHWDGLVNKESYDFGILDCLWTVFSYEIWAQIFLDKKAML